jgi:hypothetical protein
MRLFHIRHTFSGRLEKTKTKTTVLLSIASLVIGGGGLPLAVIGTAYAAPVDTIYNNVPSPLPGNLVSEAFEATSTSEFGGQVSFGGTSRNNPMVTVVMSSWACQNGSWFAGTCTTTSGSTFSEPITLNVYNVGTGNAVGSLVTTKTITFNIPYRPSSTPSMCGGDNTAWYSSADNTCYHGLATPVSFSLSGVTLPSTAIVTVAYNTSDYGALPYGDNTACHATTAGCGYDSLNVGLVNNTPSVGSNPVADSDYLNSMWSGAYCDNGAGGTGALRFDSGNTGADGACPYQPAFEVTASPSVPTTKNQCMDSGWKSYGSLFKNQGDCVSYVATEGRNQPSGQ